jgi:hypothetical protein
MNQYGRSGKISIFNGIKELSEAFSMQRLLRRDIALVVSCLAWHLSAKPVHLPCRNDIDLAAHNLFQKPIELRPSVAAFGAADAFIGKFLLR